MIEPTTMSSILDQNFFNLPELPVATAGTEQIDQSFFATTPPNDINFNTFQNQPPTLPSPVFPPVTPFESFEQPMTIFERYREQFMQSTPSNAEFPFFEPTSANSPRFFDDDPFNLSNLGGLPRPPTVAPPFFQNVPSFTPVSMIDQSLMQTSANRPNLNFNNDDPFGLNNNFPSYSFDTFTNYDSAADLFAPTPNALNGINEPTIYSDYFTDLNNFPSNNILTTRTPRFFGDFTENQLQTQFTADFLNDFPPINLKSSVRKSAVSNEQNFANIATTPIITIEPNEKLVSNRFLDRFLSRPPLRPRREVEEEKDVDDNTPEFVGSSSKNELLMDIFHKISKWLGLTSWIS